MKKDNFGEWISNNTSTAILVWLMLMAIISLSLIFCSCNVTRTITTTAEHYQRGDTTVTIVTKTTESYDATKR